MQINENQGGPWGQGPKIIHSNPERGGKRTPPDFEKFFRGGGGDGQGPGFGDWFKKFGRGGGVTLLIIGLLALWAASGVYRVEADEQAVVMRFGEFHRVSSSGLRYHFPAPFERAIIRKVTKVRVEEIGFRTSGAAAYGLASPDDQQSVIKESQMLTGDENIVDVSFTVQWQVKDIRSFVFNVRSPEELVKPAAESAMREVIGQSKFDAIITSVQGQAGVGEVEIESKAQEVLQTLLDSYGSGIQIDRLQLQTPLPPEPVIEDFRDVQRAAADRERLKNEAEAYANDIIPRARGESEKIHQEALAYKQEKVADARGSADRFLSVYAEYRQAKDITKKRLYIETMEAILRDVDKIVIDSNSSGNGVVPYLPLNELRKKTQNEGGTR